MRQKVDWSDPVPALVLRALGTPLLVLTLLVVGGGVAAPAKAHDLPYALAEVSLQQAGVVQMQLRCHLGPLILGLPQAAPDDAMLARLDRLSDREIAVRAQAVAAQLAALISLRAGGRLVDAEVKLPTTAALRAEIAAERTAPTPSAPILVTAIVPAQTRSVDVALPPSLGPAVLKVRYRTGETSTMALPEGERSRPLRFAGPATTAGRLETVLSFTANGFRHIVPAGLDHILFIAALVLGSPRVWALVKLATTFTIAHSITLSLAAFGIVAAPPLVVEPAIAFSIAAAAGLAVIRPEGGEGPLRFVLVFAFGLLHGLGFAAVLAETGLPRGDELLSLASFNVGVEIAQLAVIALLLSGLRLAQTVVPVSGGITRPATIVVALIGLGWTVQRLALALFLSPFS